MTAPAQDARPTVAVVFGGRSSEHGISCVTAGGVLGAIDRERWDVVAIGITREGRWVPASTDPADWAIREHGLPEVVGDGALVLSPTDTASRVWRIERGGGVADFASVDVVFPLLHGPFGEDGTIQGLLELIGAPYVGSGVLASAGGMDKQFMKTVFRAAGLPVAADVVVTPAQPLAEQRGAVQALGLPVFVKPARAGSSMGISKVLDWDELDVAVAEAQKHDPKVLIEATVEGREVETAVLAGEEGLFVSPAGEIVTGGEHDFYDFDAKYFDESAVQLLAPTTLDESVAAVVRTYAARAFSALGCESLARVDMFVGDDGAVTVNEINTMPGFTPTSMYPRLCAAGGIGYEELVARLIATAHTGLR